MRKNLLFYILILSTGILSAQGIDLVDVNSGVNVNNDTLTFNHVLDTTQQFPPDFKHEKFISVINTSNDTMDIDLTREELQIIPGSGDYYCWGTQCLLERQAGTTPVWTAMDPVITAGGDTAGGLAPLAIYLSPNGNVGTAVFTYTFTDLRTNNSGSVIVKWIVDYPAVASTDDIDLVDVNTGLIVNNDTLTFNHALDTSQQFPPDFKHEKFISVINATNDTMDIDLTREELQIIPGSGDYYCWGTQCLLERQAGTTPVWVANDPVITAGGDTAGGLAPLAIYLSPNGNTGTAIFKYTFTDYISRSNSSVYVKWIVSNITSLREVELNSKFSISPNPAMVSTEINFESPLNFTTQRMEIYNILGELVKTVGLSKGIQTVTIDVSDFDSGIYFVNVIADGAIVSSKKMIVK